MQARESRPSATSPRSSAARMQSSSAQRLWLGLALFVPPPYLRAWRHWLGMAQQGLREEQRKGSWSALKRRKQG